MGLLFTLTQPFGQTAIGPIFPTLMEEFHITITQASGFIGTTVLVLGFANFFWVPLAENYGRRAVFIGSLIVNLGASIWHATATSYHSYLGSCILDGFGSGPVETLFPMIIADVVFLKERGKFITLYMTALFVSLMLSPVVCSAMAQNVGWRNFFWLNVAMRGALIIASFFFFPETKWNRGLHKHTDNDQSVNTMSITKDAEHNPSKSNLEPEVEDQKIQSHHSEEFQKTQIEGSIDHIDMYLGQGRPGKLQFKQWAKREEHETVWLSLFKDFFVPFKIFFFPIVAFGGFSFSWSASVYGYVNFGQSALFSAPPYNFTVLQVGFTNFACFLGAVVGLATAGPFSDWVSMQATN
jgi:MFS family permease